MFGNKPMYTLPIDLDCGYAQSSEIGKYISISGKSYYAPVINAKDISHINLYFRVKYKKTKAAVSKEKLPFADYIKDTGFSVGNIIDLNSILDHRVYIHTNYGKASDQYIIYFTKSIDEDLYEGYLVFFDPIDKYFKDKFSSVELKLIKYLKKELSI